MYYVLSIAHTQKHPDGTTDRSRTEQRGHP